MVRIKLGLYSFHQHILVELFLSLKVNSRFNLNVRRAQLFIVQFMFVLSNVLYFSYDHNKNLRNHLPSVVEHFQLFQTESNPIKNQRWRQRKNQIHFSKLLTKVAYNFHWNNMKWTTVSFSVELDRTVTIARCVDKLWQRFVHITGEKQCKPFAMEFTSYFVHAWLLGCRSFCYFMNLGNLVKCLHVSFCVFWFLAGILNTKWCHFHNTHKLSFDIVTNGDAFTCDGSPHFHHGIVFSYCLWRKKIIINKLLSVNGQNKLWFFSFGHFR